MNVKTLFVADTRIAFSSMTRASSCATLPFSSLDEISRAVLFVKRWQAKVTTSSDKSEYNVI